MKKIAFSFLLVLLCSGVQAQIQRGLKGTYNVDDFPTISFVWNSPNPDEISSDRFVLTEEGKTVKFKVKTLSAKNEKPLPKNVLVLWEDMASHSLQSKVAQEALARFFREESFDTTSLFNVAVFNRQRDSRPQVLTPLLRNFTDNGYSLASAVEAYQLSKEKFTSNPQASDLYLAINEGITMLKKEANRAGVIMVVTGGLNVKAAGASTEMETVRKNALEANIPVYVLNYPFNGNAPEVRTLAESTYGLASSSTDVSENINNLKYFYHQIDSRLRGHDYQFTFTTNSERDGKTHPMRLTVDKVSQPLLPYTAPEVTFWMWVEEHLAICIAAVAGFILLVVLICVLLARRRKARENALQDAMEESVDKVRKESAEVVRKSEEAMERMKREQEEKVRSMKAAEEEERLMGLMKTKNLYPRLQCKTGDAMFSYTIGKPRVTLGRDATNDVVFADAGNFNARTVSGRHAEIVFNGTAFELVNVSRSYTKGIIVNGQLYQRYTLRSGDMFGLGEAVVTFYL